MPITEDAEATLLLTAYLSKQNGDATKPLTAREWSRLVQWLTKNKLTPADLMSGDNGQQLESWSDRDIPRSRIDALLQRKVALSLSLEKWERSGLWVMTRSEEDYPRRLRQKLSVESPPVLFGCGNRGLLADSLRSVAVVGSRRTTTENIAYSRDVGRIAAESGWLVVSGGASGVDEAAMQGALESDGTVIGVLHSGLIQAVRSIKYRPHLMGKRNLALVSPFNPEAGFDRGNAMGRNKHIYGFSTVAVVVHSGIEGGTWSGAMENLKRRECTPIWVKRDEEAMGNRAIAAQNGARMVESLYDLQCLLAQNGSEEARIGVYEVFLNEIRALCSDSPRTLDELYRHFKSESVYKDQLRGWLKLAIKSEKVASMESPERYKWIADEQLPLAEILGSSAESVRSVAESHAVQPQVTDAADQRQERLSPTGTMT